MSKNTSSTVRDYASAVYFLAVAFVFLIVGTNLSNYLRSITRKNIPNATAVKDLGVIKATPINISVHPIIKYRDGKLLVKATIRPINGLPLEYVGCILHGGKNITDTRFIDIVFTDKDGFQVTQVKVNRKDMIVITKNGRDTELITRKSTPISYSEYKQITGATLEWVTNPVEFCINITKGVKK